VARRRFDFRVTEDRLAAGVQVRLEAVNRILYGAEGVVALVTADGEVTTVAANEARLSAAACVLTAHEPARVWRWELAAPDTPAAAAPGAATVKFAREIELEAGIPYLMRCDRVDFPLGGVAYTHTHRGPGIRVLLEGALRVETGGHALEVRPGQAWFEAGPEPVYAAASATEPTSFVRVLVLPAELRGQPSIRYVKPEDQDKPKTQRYTVFVDAPIET
jgi:quercetin dioxygenase-like cupin family protein